MGTYLCRVIKREEIAAGTLAVHLERPPEFQFKPGQSADLTLLDPAETDEAGSTRTFSMASAPAEAELVFATRQRPSAFKRALGGLPAGAPLRLTGPAGSFTLHRDAARPAVLLAGGIGITPFLSMIRHTASTAPTRDLVLFYANRRPEEAAFLDALWRLADGMPAFRFVPTVTESRTPPQGWRGETGRIDAGMLTKHLASLQGPIYYLAGSGAMVSALSEMLLAAGVSEHDIRSEEFPGY
jgi:ferredoxin-NADP reductase